MRLAGYAVGGMYTSIDVRMPFSSAYTRSRSSFLPFPIFVLFLEK